MSLFKHVDTQGEQSGLTVVSTRNSVYTHTLTRTSAHMQTHTWIPVRARIWVGLFMCVWLYVHLHAKTGMHSYI